MSDTDITERDAGTAREVGRQINVLHDQQVFDSGEALIARAVADEREAEYVRIKMIIIDRAKTLRRKRNLYEDEESQNACLTEALAVMDLLPAIQERSQ